MDMTIAEQWGAKYSNSLSDLKTGINKGELCIFNMKDTCANCIILIGHVRPSHWSKVHGRTGGLIENKQPTLERRQKKNQTTKKFKISAHYNQNQRWKCFRASWKLQKRGCSPASVLVLSIHVSVFNCWTRFTCTISVVRKHFSTETCFLEWQFVRKYWKCCIYLEITYTDTSLEVSVTTGSLMENY